MNNSTQTMDNEYNISNVEDLERRMFIIATSSFGLIASFVTSAVILFDNWKILRKSRSFQRNPFKILFHIPNPYVVPYSLSITSIIQETAFITSQSSSYRPINGDSCKTSSQVVWTTSWINAYMLFALCLTFILRGVIPSKNFPKGIWLALSCGGVILLLLILTWIPSVAKPNLSSRCSAEPSQWVKGWADVATGLTVLLVAVYFATISVLMFRLRKSRRLSRDRRTVMKHGIFHLVLGSILYLSPLPFYVSALRLWPSQASGLVSSIAVHIFGFANSALFLILRGPRDGLSTSPDGHIWDKRSTWSSFGGADSGIVEVYRPERIEKEMESIPLRNTMPKETPDSSAKSGLGVAGIPKPNIGEFPRQEVKTSSIGPLPHSRAASETRGSVMKETLVPSNASYRSNDMVPKMHCPDVAIPQTPRLAFNSPVYHSPKFSPAVAPAELYPPTYGLYPMNPRLNVSTPALVGPNSSQKPLNMPSTPTFNRSGSLRRSLDSALLKPPYPHHRHNHYYHSNDTYKFEPTPAYPAQPAQPGPVYFQPYSASPRPSVSTYSSGTPRRLTDKTLPPIPPQDPQQVLFEAAMRLRDSQISSYSAQWQHNAHLSPLPATYQSSPWI
ncbi:hypothetical protein H109_01297 [Trichophyton interdigitale MR816]|uniref:Uncharacterized protein n=1 Tax=Trichophyton interdigitale (strain MR816) TaxID=1215338 RepID=A0A059JGT8_TRIIM|nr:hypothetical protein H101_04647 [Trichophyton interdigitale H6]KDB26893.1 hypothetical protein H109_01297 [Trichophyton interdigitale MR816]